MAICSDVTGGLLSQVQGEILLAELQTHFIIKTNKGKCVDLRREKLAYLYQGCAHDRTSIDHRIMGLI